MTAEFSLKCFTIPHKDQRYDTVGDWQTYMGNTTIRVSEMSDPRYEQLVALHEVVEYLLCRWTGVTEKQVDDFDMNYRGDGEPGDDPECPCHQQHTIAGVVEYLAAQLMGVDWNKYSEAVEALGEPQA